MRLDATDVSTATLTLKQVVEFVGTHGFATEELFLLLDLQCLFGHEKDVVCKQLLRFLALLDNRRWAGVIIGGYGVPDQISAACQTQSQTYIRRIEQDVFRDATNSALSSPSWFADYTTLSPSVVELDWRIISKTMTPKILYTIDDFFFVVRGGAFSRHPEGYGQYFSLADEIVVLDEFCGADYSYGDTYIVERHQRRSTNGNPSSWITACVNHHVTFTAKAHQR